MRVFSAHIGALLATLLLLGTEAAAQERISGKVLDADTREPVVGAAVTQGKEWALTDSLGVFSLRIRGQEPATIISMGYEALRVQLSPGGTYYLRPDLLYLQEVVVTATEERGVTAASVIQEDAIAHIQPSSLQDVLELLPGGRAADPVLSAPQVANLRSAASTVNDNYATSALGTSVLVDGKPVGNNGNLQYTPGSSSLGADNVNMGTDLRTVATEDIASLEVVRGIASVEYGDLTSGLMKITRKRGGKSLRARFKSDMNAKLFYLGKDYEGGPANGRWTLNAGVGYLDSQADPRNPRQSYRRLNGTLRAGKTWNRAFRSSLNVSLDYTGSFDDQKSDADLDFGSLGPVETYRSSYNKLALGVDYSLSAREEGSLFRCWTTNVSLSGEKDLIDRWKYNVYGADQPLSVSTEPGEYDAVIVPSAYEASMQVDGRPVNAWVSSVVNLLWRGQRLKAGVQWNYDKNFGKGYIVDPTRPLSSSFPTRPRAYSDIPANHQLSVFAEENGEVKMGKWGVEWAVGARVSAMAGLDTRYLLQLKPYVDPRVNLRISLPPMLLGRHLLTTGVYGGYGLHTKFPTMQMLSPDPVYEDVQQFNYWPAEPSLRRINYAVFKTDGTAYSLAPARNHKWELGLDLSWNGFSLGMDAFVEDLRSGFRTASLYDRYTYKDYDEKAVDKASLTGPPSLEGLPYQNETVLLAHSVWENGSRTLKKGVEFSFSSPRIPVINTKIIANGAWFITTNANSIPEYVVPAEIIGGKRYPYAGYYESNDGSTYESLTTNVVLDTQVPVLGFVFTTSFQTVWYTDRNTLTRDRYPLYYLDTDLQRHDFIAADVQDPVLRYLVRDFATVTYSYYVPFAMNVNLKATKKLWHDKVSVALFVNRVLDFSPDYYMNGGLVRRNVTPYFGMELNFKI